jgi:exosome complex component RRP4
MILGVNGYIWLSKSGKEAPNDVSITRLEEESSLEIYRDTNDEIPSSIRENIARYANCLRALAHAEVGINETRLIAAYEASLAYANVGELVEQDVMLSLAQDVVALEEQTDAFS